LVTRGIGPRLDLGMWRPLGFAPFAPGLAILIWCFADFVRRGAGTPAPYDPPQRLVIVGLYRFVRNPQYIGVALVATGEALLTGALVLFGYAALLAVGYHFVVRYYEEPALSSRFGQQYEQYCRAVPRWLPRLIGR
jgi:protein-S-isoprenylcysteine O-methyltransferase Ste14